MLTKELEREGKSVVEWLNNANAQSFGLRQVSELLVTMLTVEQTQDFAQQQNLLNAVTERLGKYKSQMWPEGISSDHRWTIYRAPADSTVEPSEWRAATTIVGIAQAGYLGKFKTCDFCHRWIFGPREDQRFCGKETGRRCKQNYWEQSERAEERNRQKRNNRSYKKRVKRIHRQREIKRLEKILANTRRGRRK